MGRSLSFDSLEKRYAYALGMYEAALRPKEPVIGYKAVQSAHAKAKADQVKYLETMAAIASEIKSRFMHDWTASHIKPINPGQRRRSGGLISRAAFAVLREAEGPMTASEIAAQVAIDLDLPTDPRSMTKLTTTVTPLLMNRADGASVRRLGEKPFRFEVVRAPKPPLSAAARTLSTASRKGGRLPPPRPSGTADRC